MQRPKLAPIATPSTNSTVPNTIGAPPVRAPKLRWAVIPPAPWQTGIPRNRAGQKIGGPEKLEPIDPAAHG